MYRLVLLASASLAVASSCNIYKTECEAGKQVECTCAGGEIGLQTCAETNSDGSGVFYIDCFYVKDMAIGVVVLTDDYPMDGSSGTWFPTGTLVAKWDNNSPPPRPAVCSSYRPRTSSRSLQSMPKRPA